MKAVRIHETGSADVLRYEDVPKPEPGEGEALVRIEAAGVNFIDIYLRNGLYPSKLPATLGMEAAGVVESVGNSVSEVRVGDKVAYAGVLGSYAEFAAVPSSRLVRLPPGMDSKLAAAVMLQGMTAHYLSNSAFPLKRGDTALVHAGAGGVGLLLVQMAKMRKAKVIAVVSTEEKAKLAKEAGAGAVINYVEQDLEAEVKKITKNSGVNVVYDSVGRATFEKSLSCLSRRGMLVLFGQSSGPVGPVDLQILSQKGSLFVTRPMLNDYVATREELLARAGEVLDWVYSGRLQLLAGRSFPLSKAAEAHMQLGSRKTVGKVLLVP